MYFTWAIRERFCVRVGGDCNCQKWEDAKAATGKIQEWPWGVTKLVVSIREISMKIAMCIPCCARFAGSCYPYGQFHWPSPLTCHRWLGFEDSPNDRVIIGCTDSCIYLLAINHGILENPPLSSMFWPVQPPIYGGFVHENFHLQTIFPTRASISRPSFPLKPPFSSGIFQPCLKWNPVEAVNVRGHPASQSQGRDLRAKPVDTLPIRIGLKCYATFLGKNMRKKKKGNGFFHHQISSTRPYLFGIYWSGIPVGLK